MVVEMFPPDFTSEPEASSFVALEQLARAMRLPSGELGPALKAILDAAVRTVPGSDEAGLILVERGQLRAVASTGPGPARLDELQRDCGDGPCIAAARDQATTVVGNLQHDGRWVELHEAAAELEVAGMVCLPLWLEERTTGALSLYSREPNAFDDADLAFTQLVATHAALALAEAQRSDQFARALASRDVLGQAKGVLMERFRISADDAFRRLATTSQARNEKVTAVAEYLVRTGELLES